MFLPANITLKFGDSGDFVSELQRRLKTVHCFSGDSSGFYDGVTAAGVTQFQTMSGIRADGIAGPETLRRLNVVISGDTSTTNHDEEQNRLRQEEMQRQLIQQEAQAREFQHEQERLANEQLAAEQARQTEHWQHGRTSQQPEIQYAQEAAYAPQQQPQEANQQVIGERALQRLQMEHQQIAQSAHTQPHEAVAAHHAPAVAPPQVDAQLVQHTPQLQPQPAQAIPVHQPQQQLPVQVLTPQTAPAVGAQAAVPTNDQHHHAAPAVATTAHLATATAPHAPAIAAATHTPHIPVVAAPAPAVTAIVAASSAAAIAATPSREPVAEPVIAPKGIVGRAVQYANDMVQKLSNYFESKLPSPVIDQVKEIGLNMAKNGVREAAIPMGPAEPQRGQELPARTAQPQQARG